MDINKANKPKRRLSNFRIKEISVVDEAANEKEFLIVKSKEIKDKDNKLFKKTDKQDVTDTKQEVETSKFVTPLTFAALVMSSDELRSQMEGFYYDVKSLDVSEDGNYNMGPELTGRAVSMLEKLSDMLFMFGSDSTLGFADPAFMSTAKYFNKKYAIETVGIEKVGRPMNASRLKTLENSVDVLESGLSSIKELLRELKIKEEQMTKEELAKKEAELQKRMKEQESVIRKELGLEEKETVTEPPAEEPKETPAEPEAKESNVDEVAKLKAKVEALEKEKIEKENIAKDAEHKAQIESLEKRIKELESVPISKSEEESEEIEKNKEQVEFVEKNGRKVRKDLWKGLTGRPLKTLLETHSKKY